MEIDNRVLAGAFVVVLVVVLFVFIGQREKISFSDGVLQVNDLWGKNGFEQSSVSDSDQEEISLEQLNALNDDLLLFEGSLSGFEQDGDVEALRDFVEVQLYLVEELKLALEIRDSKSELEQATGDDVCFYYDELKALAENTILLNQQMKIVNETIYSFSEEHPDFISQSNLESLLVVETDFDSIIAENQEILGQLKEACG